MTNDLILVIGVVVFALSVPAILSAFVDNRSPRRAAALAAVGVAMVAYALSQAPGGVDLALVPAAFARLIGEIVN